MLAFGMRFGVPVPSERQFRGIIPRGRIIDPTSAKSCYKHDIRLTIRAAKRGRLKGSNEGKKATHLVGPEVYPFYQFDG